LPGVFTRETCLGLHGWVAAQNDTSAGWVTRSTD
jgi:hypothetical protein